LPGSIFNSARMGANPSSTRFVLAGEDEGDGWRRSLASQQERVGRTTRDKQPAG
jgi:hypothetical protein